jgi:hypothetical protein
MGKKGFLSQYTVNLADDPYLSYRVCLAGEWAFLQGA